MVTLEKLRREKREQVLQLAEMHGARNVRVFGSFVRAENRQGSDLDLLMEFDKGRTLFDLIGLKLDLEDLLGIEVDVVTPNSLRYVRDRVMAEAQPL